MIFAIRDISAFIPDASLHLDITHLRFVTMRTINRCQMTKDGYQLVVNTVEIICLYDSLSCIKVFGSEYSAQKRRLLRPTLSAQYSALLLSRPHPRLACSPTPAPALAASPPPPPTASAAPLAGSAPPRRPPPGYTESAPPRPLANRVTWPALRELPRGSGRRGHYRRPCWRPRRRQRGGAFCEGGTTARPTKEDSGGPGLGLCGLVLLPPF